MIQCEHNNTNTHIIIIIIPILNAYVYRVDKIFYCIWLLVKYTYFNLIVNAWLTFTILTVNSTSWEIFSLAPGDNLAF